jgi:7,8-dihydroneopterin aldolase/epimerase/oxygenase
MSKLEGRGAAWTEERGTSDEGRRRHQAPRKLAGEQSTSDEGSRRSEGGMGRRAGPRKLAGNTDRISLLGLRAFGRHGVLEHERVSGQEFVIDAVLFVDTRAAAAADDLALTADYGALADRLAGIVAGRPVALIETLAQRLAAACLADPAVHEVEITVHKPHAPVAQHVADIAVTIRRSRDVDAE